MGTKSLNQLPTSKMGNSIPNGSSESFTKVFHSDGTVRHYDMATTAAELMLEHPQQIVFELEGLMSGKKEAAPLPADKNLEQNKVYLMLPKRRGKPAALTLEQVDRIILSRANGLINTKPISSWSGFLQLLGRICLADSAKSGFVSNWVRESKIQ